MVAPGCAKRSPASGYQPGGDALQGGLAGTVATNQADPIAGCNGESRAGKRRRCHETQADLLKQQ